MTQKLQTLAFVLALLKTQSDFFYGGASEKVIENPEGAMYFHLNKSCRTSISCVWAHGKISL